MDLGKLTHYRLSGAVAFTAGMAALFLIYVLALKAASRLGGSRLALALVLAFTLLQGLILVAVYPIGALDVFAYVFQGRLLAHYHANPFVVAPAAFPDDPMVPLLAWEHEPSTYGALWVALEGLASLFYRNDMLAGLVLYKLLGLLCYLLTAYLVYLLLLQQRAREPVAGALVFAWNPLLIWETAANGHNDIAMALLALAAVYAFVRDRVRLSHPLLIASVLVKFVTLVLYPAFLVSTLRGPGKRTRKLSDIIWGLAMAALVIAAFYAPFWVGPETVGALRRGDLFTASPTAAAFHLLSASGFATASQTVKLVGGGLFALFVAWRSVLVRPGTRPLLSASFDILFAYFVLATFWFQPWYLAVLLPFAAALEDSKRRRLALIFTASAVLNYLVFDYLWLWFPETLGLVQVQALAAACIYGPPLAYVLWTAAQSTRPHARLLEDHNDR